MDNDFVAKWAAAASSFDVGAFDVLFSDDAVYEDVTVARVSSGRAAIADTNRETLAMIPDFHLADVSGFVSNDHGVIEWTMTGTLGDAFAVRGVSVLELRDGLVTRCADYWDLATMLRQLGQMPSG